jgi:hypothetical protein
MAVAVRPVAGFFSGALIIEQASAQRPASPGILVLETNTTTPTPTPTHAPIQVSVST